MDDSDVIDMLRTQLEEERVTREQLEAILTETANVLKGDPGPLKSWGWHDLPEVARKAFTER